MTKHIRLALLMAAVALPTLAAAKPPAPAPAPAVSCADSGATIGNAGYVACQGPTAGNIAPGQTNSATFAGFGTFDFVGKTDDPGAGPFTSNPGGFTSGTLTFDSVQKGYFVLGIKGGPDYSLYLFNGGVAGIKTLKFDTLGITKGNGDPGPGLSHLGLFTQQAQPIPEPQTYALMLAGLLGVGFAARRKGHG